MVEERLEKYSLARKWNLFVKSIEEARDTWDSLQKEIDVVGEEEIERTYPMIAQKHLSHFRKVEFHWMIRLFVDYYRGAGGLDEMYIILPPEEQKRPNSWKDEVKTIKVEEEKKNGSK